MVKRSFVFLVVMLLVLVFGPVVNAQEPVVCGVELLEVDYSYHNDGTRPFEAKVTIAFTVQSDIPVEVETHPGFYRLESNRLDYWQTGSMPNGYFETWSLYEFAEKGKTRFTVDQRVKTVSGIDETCGIVFFVSAPK